MELFHNIIDLGKDLIEKYSQIPVDIDKDSMYLIRSHTEVLELFVRREDVILSLYRKEISTGRDMILTIGCLRIHEAESSFLNSVGPKQRI